MAIIIPPLITPSAPTSSTAAPVSSVLTRPPVASSKSAAPSSVTTTKSSATPSPSSSSSSSPSPSPTSSSSIPSSSATSDTTSEAPSTTASLSVTTPASVPTSLSSSLPAESSTSALPEPTSSPGSQFNLGRQTLIGIAFGGAVFVILVGGLCWFLGRQRRQRRRHRAAALEDDLAAGAALNFRRRSRLSRAGWSRSIDETKENEPELSPYPLPPRRHDITHGEARDSVRVEYPFGSGVASTRPSTGYGHPNEGGLFVPPRRGYGYPSSDRSSMWADNSEADMYAHDGSTIARTISTVTQPNSEYNLENDPGATMHHPVPPQAAYRNTAFSNHSTGTFGPPETNSSNNSAFGNIPMGAVGPMAAMGHYPPLSQPGTLHSVHSSLSSASAFVSPAAPGRGSSAAYLPSATTSPVSLMSTLSLAPHAPHASHAHAPGAQAFYDSSSGASSPIGTVNTARRIPAPRLLVDTKAPVQWEEGRNSTVVSPGVGPSGWAGSATGTPIDRARMTSPPPSSMSFGAVPPHSAPAVVRARADLPYSTTEPGPAASDPAVIAAVAQTSTSPTRSEPAAGPSRRHTIVRHADAGAFDDAVPDGDASGDLHLPPAYGDIYGPPEPESQPQPPTGPR